MKKTYFLLGPTTASKKVLRVGSKQLKEFRNEKFSRMLKSLEKGMLNLANAPKNSRVIFLSSSGTGGMQSVVENFIDEGSSALVINGGNFGQRFVNIMEQKKLKCFSFDIDPNEKINSQKLKSLNFDSIFVNSCETSTGRLYNIKKLGKIAKEKNALFIVDAISSFLCDEIDMKKQNIDVLIISSNKGLSL